MPSRQLAAITPRPPQPAEEYDTDMPADIIFIAAA